MPTHETFPEFFAAVPRVATLDPLAELLGAGGRLDYGFADAVRLAGHACPTVAGAYGLTAAALRALYGDALPVRGDIAVDCAGELDEGVTGVIASVITLITGAAGPGGFKGLGGQFARRNLLRFGVRQARDYRFTRRDTGAAVDAGFDLSGVAGSPEMGPLLSLCLGGQANAEQRQRFGQLWQARVRSILLEHWGDPAVFRVDPVTRP
jgi:hypothetical protein